MNQIEQIALKIDALAVMGYQNPKEALMRIAEMNVPKELIGLRDAVQTHLFWCKQAEARGMKKG